MTWLTVFFLVCMVQALRDAAANYNQRVWLRELHAGTDYGRQFVTHPTMGGGPR